LAIAKSSTNTSEHDHSLSDCLVSLINIPGFFIQHLTETRRVEDEEAEELIAEESKDDDAAKAIEFCACFGVSVIIRCNSDLKLYGDKRSPLLGILDCVGSVYRIWIASINYAGVHTRLVHVSDDDNYIAETYANYVR